MLGEDWRQRSRACRTICGASIRPPTSRANQKPRTEWVKAIAEHLRGDAPSLDLPIDVQATAFQWKVWRALQRIPYGETRAYAEVARSIGKPKAVRAVARACATNPVCLVVPCHRVVPKAGGTGGYRWGADRKERLLLTEQRAEQKRRTSCASLHPVQPQCTLCTLVHPSAR